ncbi:MAG TPA: hypothetical protein VK013_13825, partial [Myxococcaceae bacterium]|nr:hypothetical protein [Myxococcaceae bacterium]
MHALKSSLVLLASLAIVGCPSSDPVTPQPQPQPNPPPVLGPCDEADALRDGSQVVRWAKPYSEEALLAPDADGRVGAVVLFEDGQARAAALRDRGFKVTRELSVLNGVAVRATEAELAALANEPFVRHVQRDYAFRSGTLYRTPVPPPAFLAQAGPIIEEPSE